MNFTFLPEIDIRTYAHQSQGLSPLSLSYIGKVFAKVDHSNIDEAFVHLERTAGAFLTFVEASELDRIDDIISLLDSGAAGVFINRSQLHRMRQEKAIQWDRVILIIAGEEINDIVNTVEDTPVRLFWPQVSEVNVVQEWLKKWGSGRPQVFISLAEPQKALAIGLSGLNCIPIFPATLISTDREKEPNLICASTLFLAKATTDRTDGLFTTLVTDERDVALGIVYSNAESVAASLRTGEGVYYSRKRGLWHKGATSGDTQELLRVDLDCDGDCLRFTVRQKGRGFCHLGVATCFGSYRGLSRLQKTLDARRTEAPNDSYTARLLRDPQLLKAKIMEEAHELCEASTSTEIAFEAADLLYFALTKCIGSGVGLEEIEKNLDAKSVKVRKRAGEAKDFWIRRVQDPVSSSQTDGNWPSGRHSALSQSNSATEHNGNTGKLRMRRLLTSECTAEVIKQALRRPSQRSSHEINKIVDPIIEAVKTRGDRALLEYTHKFEKATSLVNTVLKAPFPSSLMEISDEVKAAIDLSFDNIRQFHAAQLDKGPIQVETMPGVVCGRFSRAIERVGLYIPGGTAVLPSTALMLGVPAMVAGCKTIVLASPPQPDGSLKPEIVYVASKIGAESIVLAGGAQAIAALAHGTESVSKVDKILGPGNQFVTAAKMIVSNDTNAGVSIDMPAGPSEVLVIADKTAHPGFVAADLLSQAEHGIDSQVILIAVGLDRIHLDAIDEELHVQAATLPRLNIVSRAIENSVTFVVDDIAEAMTLSNDYAPEHLILQVQNAPELLGQVRNAGSVFIGPWSPESVGDYSAGVNHSLPTYGYARQYSGVSLSSYIKHITSSTLTPEGLQRIGGAVMRLAQVEELEAHKRAVQIRLEELLRTQSV